MSEHIPLQGRTVGCEASPQSRSSRREKPSPLVGRYDERIFDPNELFVFELIEPHAFSPRRNRHSLLIAGKEDSADIKKEN